VSGARDPRRSLLIGSAIAAVVLVAMALVVLVGVVIVFRPRRSGRDSLGPPAGSPPAAIHLVASSTS
jgi:hypothetical protein